MQSSIWSVDTRNRVGWQPSAIGYALVDSHYPLDPNTSPQAMWSELPLLHGREYQDNGVVSGLQRSIANEVRLHRVQDYSAGVPEAVLNSLLALV